MSRPLSDAERALWERVAATVDPIRKPGLPRNAEADRSGQPHGAPAAALPQARKAAAQQQPNAAPSPRTGDDHRIPPLRHGLDASWDRRLAKGQAAPDFTLDLHGCTLDQAHARLDHGLTLALSQGARVVLLITGRPRPLDDHASRGDRRGAIRAKFLDWLQAGPHASRIAAIRPAHPRHGGGGAVYLVLRARRPLPA